MNDLLNAMLRHWLQSKVEKGKTRWSRQPNALRDDALKSQIVTDGQRQECSASTNSSTRSWSASRAVAYAKV